jgi:hypothetical protein
MPFPHLAASSALALMLSSLPAIAQSDDSNQNVFVLGGQFTTGYIQDTFRFWEDHYEDNFFAGIGYQHFIYEYEDFSLGGEIGIGLRAGERSSAEVWAGVVARYDGFQIGDITISPALTAGFSFVTDTIGIETERAATLGYGVPFLYYLGPEVSVSHASLPNLELLARVHHRSGGFGTIAPIDAANAATIGLRFKF